MPNAKNCNSCGIHLSMHRHNSFFLKNKNSERFEVCKQCYKAGCFQRKPINDDTRITLDKELSKTTSISSVMESSSTTVVLPRQRMPLSIGIELTNTPAINDDTGMTTDKESSKPASVSSPFEGSSARVVSPRQKMPLSIESELTYTSAINCHQSLIIDAPLVDCIFIDTETTSLNEPEIIELCLRSVDGIVYHKRFKPYKQISDKAYQVHKISEIDLIDAPRYEQEEENILSLLSGKKLISYNVAFDCKAMRISSKNPLLTEKYRQIENNSICLMDAIRSKLKCFKSISLVDACTQFETTLLPAHSAVNDTNMLMDLYIKFRQLLIANPSEWLPSFFDINFYNLTHCERNKSIPFWISKDEQRQALYRPHTSGGVGKVAEIGDKLKRELSQWASAEFVLQDTDEGLPLILVNFISESELKSELEQEREKYTKTLREQLLSAKAAKNGKLRLVFKEYNYNRRYLGNNHFKTDAELYQCKYSMGDTLYLDPIKDLDSFNLMDIVFKNKFGEDYGRLLNLTQAWTRVFGLLVQGYRAEVLILDDNKFNTKVDVYLFKD